MLGLLRQLLIRYSLTILFAIITIITVIDSFNPRFSAFIRKKSIDSFASTFAAVNKLVDTAIEIQQAIIALPHLRHDNMILKQENELLKYHYQLAKQTEAENLQLKSLLNFVGNINFSYITTRVIGNTSSPYIKSVLVMAGQAEGVKKGQIVVNHEGLVGRIIEAAEHNSRVLLITDLNSKIPSISLETQEKGIVAGDNTNKLKILYLPEETKIKEGEVLVTAGDGHFFLPGIPIAITKKEKKHSFIAEPIVKWHKLEYVSIINYLPK
jgi:rod shape-determining protein MreC